ncbi:uncharacterized protein YALI1_B05639g [Yarrowia lipolytica]|uniref:Uncharacterized protein n=1 Tax=Yarrowia lipolytica TaxID=4952 RepID=A0A1D8N6E2_YARLL|nr:hypothetical protein YALI1_B05639g [Yarrowia lipolytica]
MAVHCLTTSDKDNRACHWYQKTCLQTGEDNISAVFILLQSSARVSSSSPYPIYRVCTEDCSSTSQQTSLSPSSISTGLLGARPMDSEFSADSDDINYSLCI